MAQTDTSTRKFTDMSVAQLRASMAQFEGLCVVATVNPDGTPDAAVFAPVMPDDEHVILMLADNHTRANLERTGKARLVYDAANPRAEEKAARHAGARLDVSLVRQDGETAEEYEHVARNFPRMNPAVVILRIERILPIG
ncbi:pyridoxamine 5'-phosphate oxidase family protein [Slackia piriformis]|mgnify:CR=1 FL=1|nr:pyridoxamine 5'-phosphate oxidase family protein [Slackia piriformis]